MIADILFNGFALARRRVHLIFLDIAWKAVWFAVTAGSVLLVGIWFGRQAGSMERHGSDVPGLNGLMALGVLTQFWADYGSEMLWAIGGVLILSSLLWLVLEAFFHAQILASAAGWEGAWESRLRLVSGPRTARFRLFLFSNVAKVLLFVGAACSLGLISLGQYLTTPVSEWPRLWNETHGAVIISLVALLGLAFVLTILDTLVRSDAIELFGTDLIRVSGVIGILLMFETLIGTSLAVVIVAELLNSANAAEALATIGLAAGGMLLMSLIHSYLLIVRFFAVGIMKHNVIEI